MKFLAHIIQRITLYLLLGWTTMTLTVNCLIASQLQENKNLQDVKVHISGENITLEQVLQLIEQQTEFKFFYIKDEIPLNKKVKIKQKESLFHILRNLEKECGLTFNRINNQIVVKKVEPDQSGIYKVSGTVRDGSTHEPLVFANIVVKGTQQGIATDAKGKFLLNLQQRNDTLRCSYVGYKTVEIPISVNKDIQLSINLLTMDVLLQDVTIYAYQGRDKELTNENALSLQSEKIKTSSSVFPDVMRSVQMLPGVSTNNEFNAKFNVRGGNEDENLVLVNGTQVYEPYHLKEAVNYSIGIMNTELISKMDLITGGFPARYGDKMSSVLNIDYREGDKERFRGKASLSLTDVDVVAEGPLGNNGSFVFGARKTYLEYIMRLVTEASFFPAFYDVQGVVNYLINSNHKLLFKFIHAGDSYIQDTTVEQSDLYRWYSSGDGLTNSHFSGDSTSNRMQYYSTLLALQIVNIISSSAILKTELSFYDQRENEQSLDNHYYRYRGEKPGDFYFNNITTKYLYHNDLSIQTIELNSTLDQQLLSSYGIKTGLSYQHIIYKEDQLCQRTIDQIINYYYNAHPDTTIIHQVDNTFDYVNNQMNTQSYKFTGYVENIIQLNDRLLLNLGGRFDYFDLNKDLAWSPRVNLSYQTGGGLTLRGAWGYYYQSPNHRQIAYSVASDTNTQSQRAVHYVLGADYNVNPDPESFLKLKVECFYKRYDDLISATKTSYGYVYYSRMHDAVGSSKGADVYLMYSVSGFYGWVSYSYLSANQDVLNDTYGSFPRNTDQTHTLTAVGDLDLGDRWSLAVRFVYGSGYPYTPLYAKYNTRTYTWEWFSGAPNSERLPSYCCVDLRIAKSFEMFGFAASAFLDVSNLFNASNILAYQYSIDNGRIMKKEMKLAPIVPSLGMSIRF